MNKKSNESKKIELPPIRETKEDWDRLEKRLKELFKKQIYYPLLAELQISRKTLQNTAHPNPLMDALFIGRVVYSAGAFSGDFNAGISKELRGLGAKFNRKDGTYRLDWEDLPQEVKNIISSSYNRFQEKLASLDKKLASLSPEVIASELKAADLFDITMFKADREFRKNVKKIVIMPEVPKEIRERISKEWQNNMQLDIKNWTEQQIKDLRKKIYEGTFRGERREYFVPSIQKITETIQESYDESVNKAKFLARQETNLLMSSFKQARYEAAGSQSYIWRCVHRPHDQTPKQHTPGNVRYAHALLDGKEYKWSEPPITTNPGQPVRRNHPGQDYNCRCFARPIIRK